MAELSDRLSSGASAQIEQAQQYLSLWRAREEGRLTSPEAVKLLEQLERDRSMTPEVAVATLRDPDLRAQQELFAEGGAGRVALHTLTGALGGGIQGALGAGDVAAAAPQINEWQHSAVSTALGVTRGLGISDGYATMFGQATGQLTASGLGAALGSGTGAGFALAVDTNNRQFHQSEVRRIKALSKGDTEAEQRLFAAACALVRCVDGVPKDDPNHELLARLQEIGAGMKAEQALLSSQIGQNGRVVERLFQYSWVDAFLTDPASQAKLGARAAGGGQFVLGALGVAASGASCVTGWGCAAGLVGGTVSFDYVQAGLRQAWSGTGSVPYGEQVLRAVGLSDEAAAFGYGLLGLGATAFELRLANSASGSRASVGSTGKRTAWAPDYSDGPQWFAGGFGNVGNGKVGFVDLSAPGDIAPGFYRANPAQLRFTQSDASPFFSKGGTIDGLVTDLRSGRVTADQVGNPLNVVIHDNLPFSIDNRRLVAFNLAGAKDVPIQIVSLENPAVAARFFDRFDPIGGLGKNIVITPSSGRTASQMLLRDSGLIQGVQLGR